MSGLLSLEPEPLRRLLTLGLRGGLTEADLDRHCQAAAALLGQGAEELRAGLQERGWIRWDPERQRWRTRLSPTTSSPSAQA